MSAEAGSSTFRMARDRASPPTIAANMRTARSMPWFNLKAMTESDRRAVYHYIRDLGPAGTPAPPYVVPGGCCVERYRRRNSEAFEPAQSRRQSSKACFVAYAEHASF